MAAYRLTSAARSDLANISRHTINQWSVAQAGKYTSEIQNACELLATNPALGRSDDKIRPGLRRFEHASHVIWYTVSKESLTVIRILHKSVLPQRHLT